MWFVDPLIALVASFMFLAVMLYKRVNLGVTLVSTALVLGLLSLRIEEIPRLLWQTTFDPVTESLVGASFGIMVLSQLYKETGAIDTLSNSLSEMTRKPKLVVSMLPALVGLLPVAGGALMSAPMVETEADKLDLERAKKTFVNIWFRHVIFPIYPMSQVLILAAALTETSLTMLVLRQIPVVVVMIVVGYFIGLRKSSVISNERDSGKEIHRNLRAFLLMFSPILAMILIVVLFKVDVVIAAFIGVILLAIVKRPSGAVLGKVLGNKAVYIIALAAYGAMLLRSVTIASGVSQVIGQILAAGNIHHALLLASLPAVLGFLVGSPSGGIAISVPMLASALTFTSEAASLLYISAYFGYLGAPTHLCLVLTADYFKCPLSKTYKYMIPSLTLSFAAALIVYLLF